MEEKEEIYRKIAFLMDVLAQNSKLTNCGIPDTINAKTILKIKERIDVLIEAI